MLLIILSRLFTNQIVKDKELLLTSTLAQLIDEFSLVDQPPIT